MNGNRSNLSSTVNYPPYNKIVRYLTYFPTRIYYVIVGIILSDGNMSRGNGLNARIVLKQSIYKSEYLLYCFILLSHYCSRYPYLDRAKTGFVNICIITRALPCITDIYNVFYSNNVKVVLSDIYHIMNIETLAH